MTGEALEDYVGVVAWLDNMVRGNGRHLFLSWDEEMSRVGLRGGWCSTIAYNRQASERELFCAKQGEDLSSWVSIHDAHMKVQ